MLSAVHCVCVECKQPLSFCCIGWGKETQIDIDPFLYSILPYKHRLDDPHSCLVVTTTKYVEHLPQQYNYYHHDDDGFLPALCRVPTEG